MKKCKKTAKILMTTGLVLALNLVLEAKMLNVKHIKLKAPITELEGFKILHFTDLHLGNYYKLKELDALVDRLNSLDADVVFFTGDLLDSKSKTDIDVGLTGSILKRVESKRGKYAVLGNHDTRKDGSKVEAILDYGNFITLRNSSTKIRIKDKQIAICGIDDYISGDKEISKAFDELDNDIVKLVLCHEGDLIDKLVCPNTGEDIYGIDYMFSGHTHGGQIKLPFIETTWLPYLGEKYVDGQYVINDRTTLSVSTGIGATSVPFRINNKPEIIMYEFE